MNILIDKPSRNLLRWLRDGRGRHYYLAEPPALGIIVMRCGTIDDMAGMTVDAALGCERGVEGWCNQGYEGKKHGKITIYKVVEGAKHQKTLSQVIEEWKKKYPMK